MVTFAKPKRVIPVLNFECCGDHVLFEDIAADETPGGLVMPENASMGPPRGFVVAVGPGLPCQFNPKERMPMSCKPGDVIYLRGEATRVWLDGKPYGLIRDLFIVAKAPQG